MEQRHTQQHPEQRTWQRPISRLEADPLIAQLTPQDS